MKKFFTLIAALVLASSLSMPAFAKTKKHHTKKHHATSQAHKKHAKKKGAKHGQKKGQSKQ